MFKLELINYLKNIVYLKYYVQLFVSSLCSTINSR